MSFQYPFKVIFKKILFLIMMMACPKHNCAKKVQIVLVRLKIFQKKPVSFWGMPEWVDLGFTRSTKIQHSLTIFLFLHYHYDYKMRIGNK